MGVKIGKKAKGGHDAKAAPAAAAAKPSKAGAVATGNGPPIVPDPRFVAWEGDKLFHVRLDNADVGAVIPAETKGEAKERFLELAGISSTDRQIKVSQLEAESSSDRDEWRAAAAEELGLPVDVHGVVNYKPRGDKRAKHDDESDD